MKTTRVPQALATLTVLVIAASTWVGVARAQSDAIATVTRVCADGMDDVAYQVDLVAEATIIEDQLGWQAPEDVVAPTGSIGSVLAGDSFELGAAQTGMGYLVDLATGGPVLNIHIEEPVPRCELARDERFAGENRYDTAAAFALSNYEQANLVYLANGESGLVDALVVAGAPLGESGPVLLVADDRLPSATRDALKALRPNHVRVLGGTDRISSDVYQEAVAAAFGES